MGLGATIKQAAGWLAPGAFVVNGTSKNGSASITFDDGPHPENTPRILDDLDAHSARATFFLQGSVAEAHPAIVREIVRRGHQVGNHGQSHLDAKAVSANAYLADALRCQTVLEDIVGQTLPRNFRPPYGHIAPASTLTLLRHGFRFIFWSMDSSDSFLPDAAALVNHVKAQTIRADSILLFHDDYAHTAAALPEILVNIQQRGLKLVTLADLLEEPR